MKMRSGTSISSSILAIVKSRGLSSTRSILFSTTIFCMRADLSRSMMPFTSSSMPAAASMTSRHRIRVFDAAPCRIDHRAIQTALRTEDAGRVDENDLAVAFDRDAANGRPGRLNFMRDDRDLGADERVDERRLAGIRRPDDGDEPASLIGGPRVRTFNCFVLRHRLCALLRLLELEEQLPRPAPQCASTPPRPARAPCRRSRLRP